MSQIPDFTETELWTLRTALTERYGAPVDLQLADGEVRLNPESSTLSICPVAYWAMGGANFVIFKVGESEYRSQFYYRARDQYATGRDYYDNLGECVTILLQVQADHERKQNLKADKS
jgi:hypothetical protein